MGNETAAGRMARTMPELDRRELSALMRENQHREHTGHVPAAWVLAEMAESAERAILERAWDAHMMALAVALHGPGSAAYWAALP